MPDITLADVMRTYANDAIAFSKRRFDFALDFSEQSLESIDCILADYTKSGLIVPDNLSATEQEELWILCKLLGGYVGEVIIRNIGGEWQQKDVGEEAAYIKLVTVGGVEGSPPDAIWRVLTEPYKASMETYYQGLKAILGHGDEVIEHGIRGTRLPPLSAQSPGQKLDADKRPWWKFW